jgi:hypothetical protein
MGGTIVVPNKQALTVHQQKQCVQKKVVKLKPGPAPVALTNSDVKNAVKGWLDITD